MSATETRDKLRFNVPVVEALGVTRTNSVAKLGHSFSYDSENIAGFMNRVSDAFPLDLGHVVVVDGFPDEDRLRNYHASLSLELGSKFPEQIHGYELDEKRLRLEVKRVG